MMNQPWETDVIRVRGVGPETAIRELANLLDKASFIVSGIIENPDDTKTWRIYASRKVSENSDVIVGSTLLKEAAQQ